MIFEPGKRVLGGSCSCCKETKDATAGDGEEDRERGLHGRVNFLSSLSFNSGRARVSPNRASVKCLIVMIVLQSNGQFGNQVTELRLQLRRIQSGARLIQFVP